MYVLKRRHNDKITIIHEGSKETMEIIAKFEKPGEVSLVFDDPAWNFHIIRTETLGCENATNDSNLKNAECVPLDKAG